MDKSVWLASSVFAYGSRATPFLRNKSSRDPDRPDPFARDFFKLILDLCRIGNYIIGNNVWKKRQQDFYESVFFERTTEG